MEQATESRTKGYFRSSPPARSTSTCTTSRSSPSSPTPAEERRLARLAQKGDEAAAERLVTANLRFVISYVKKYQGHGLDLGELVAIGNEGLLKAVRKFDPDQGVKFISYAVWWVRQAVLKALAEQTRSVRIPLNQNSQLIRLARAETILAQVLKRDPTDDGARPPARGDARAGPRRPADVRRRALARRAGGPLRPRSQHPRRALRRRGRHARSRTSTDYKLMREFIDRVLQAATSRRASARSSTSTTDSRKAPRR